ncbi:MAG: hypothetical protein ACRC37_06780, partial [Lentisphaeria bacterium]
IESIETNQTLELIEVYKKHYSDTSIYKILDQVNLMTPENIHVNTFMYEPLIDMSVYHLIDLYKKAVELLK